MADTAIIEEKYRALSGLFDEATFRLWTAVEARTLGRARSTACNNCNAHLDVSSICSIRAGNLSLAPQLSPPRPTKTLGQVSSR